MSCFVALEFVPLHNPMGFGPADALLLTVALLLVFPAVLWRPWIAPFAARLARRTGVCMLGLAVLPVALRLILLPNHPVPTPDLYDEFGHLLVARTLMHLRLANPPHPLSQFFETHFVLQHPAYASIYPVGNGLAMALGWFVFGLPWAGVLLGVAAFCALAYWMLRAWITPGWALFGGLLAVFQFGPLNQWTNNYWGGAFSAAAGCLVFGAMPRIRNQNRRRDGILLGTGLGLHLLSRPYESIFLLVAVVLYLLPQLIRLRPPRALWWAALPCLAAAGITLLQNRAVTGESTKLPYVLSQQQYGVPAVLTIQSTPVPTGPMTPQQELDYRMQRGFHPGRDTLGSFLDRLVFRVRYYRFYFFPPLYLALAVFLFSVRSWRWAYVPGVCLVFALGVNLFPAFQFHYVAAVVCLFLLMSVKGLERLSRLRQGGIEGARFLILLCAAQFLFWYGTHLADRESSAIAARSWDLWDSINHANPERRIDVAKRIAAIPGQLIVFVRYWPGHAFQDEWVYNEAEIGRSRVIWARDLGAENRRLMELHPDRKVFLLEPDSRPPSLEVFELEPLQGREPTSAPPPDSAKPAVTKKPLLELEQVR